MSVDPSKVFDTIEDKIRSIVGKTNVYVSEIPPDDAIPYDSRGTMKPFVVIGFGGPIRAAVGRNLVSTRRDVTVLFVTVEVYAPTAKIARNLKGLIIDGLTGFREGDMSELILSGLSLAAVRASNAVRPTMYIDSQSWQCYSNLEDV